MSVDKPAVVIDNGSYNIKAGFACDNHPLSIFRTVVGRPTHLRGSYGKEEYKVYLGDDAENKGEELELFSPVREGRIVHWDNMERVWYHTFYKELKVAPEDGDVMLAVSPLTPMSEKIQCCEVFFETMNSPCLCIQPQSVLAMYGAGQTTGLAVDLGYDTAQVAPVYEGGLIKYAVIDTKLPSREVSKYLEESLKNCGVEATPQTIEGVKKCLYVTKDVAMARADCKKTYTLPSGEDINVCNEAFMAGEMLFQPDLVCGRETEYLPLQEALVDCSLRCDPDLRESLFEAVVVCGGMATIPGVSNRLGIELESIIEKPVNILHSSEAYTTTWLGGAVLAGMSATKKMWVTKKQYEDYGVKIIRNKFI